MPSNFRSFLALSAATAAHAVPQGATTAGDSWFVPSSAIFSARGAELTSELQLPARFEGTHDVFLVPTPHDVHVARQQQQQQPSEAPPPRSADPAQSKSAAREPKLRALFSSSEHYLLASQARLPGFSDGSDAVTRVLPVDVGGAGSGVRVKYGDVIALGGDFFGAEDPPISMAGGGSAGADKVWNDAVDSMLNVASARGEVPKIMALINKEASLADAASPASSAWTSGKMDKFDADYNRATGGGSFASGLFPLGRYLDLAMNNEDHFAPGSATAYLTGHASACAAAAAAKSISSASARDAALARAYLMNAFADHYLTDMFAAGHLRVPRAQLGEKGFIGPIGDRLSQHMHDEDNSRGVGVVDGLGNAWTAFGDHKYRDAVNAANRARVLAAVAASVAEVAASFASGSAPATRMQAYFPRPAVPATSVPLFKLSPGGRVLRRQKIDDPTYNVFTDDWSPTRTLAKLEAGKFFAEAPEAVPSSPGAATTGETVVVGAAGSTVTLRLHVVGRGSKVSPAAAAAATTAATTAVSNGAETGTIDLLCGSAVVGSGAVSGTDGTAVVTMRGPGGPCPAMAIRWRF
jgi:hypothetical protein